MLRLDHVSFTVVLKICVISIMAIIGVRSLMTICGYSIRDRILTILLVFAKNHFFSLLNNIVEFHLGICLSLFAQKLKFVNICISCNYWLRRWFVYIIRYLLGWNRGIQLLSCRLSCLHLVPIHNISQFMLLFNNIFLT